MKGLLLGGWASSLAGCRYYRQEAAQRPVAEIEVEPRQGKPPVQAARYRPESIVESPRRRRDLGAQGRDGEKTTTTNTHSARMYVYI